jgi:multiple sugar transport system permease protein
MTTLDSTMARSAPARLRPRKANRPKLGHTAVGLLLLAVMLFPVYWMVNASLQPSGNTLTADFLPLNPSFEGYEKAIAQ